MNGDGVVTFKKSYKVLSVIEVGVMFFSNTRGVGGFLKEATTVSETPERGAMKINNRKISCKLPTSEYF